MKRDPELWRKESEEVFRAYLRHELGGVVPDCAPPDTASLEEHLYWWSRVGMERTYAVPADHPFWSETDRLNPQTTEYSARAYAEHVLAADPNDVDALLYLAALRTRHCSDFGRQHWECLVRLDFGYLRRLVEAAVYEHAESGAEPTGSLRACLEGLRRDIPGFDRLLETQVNHTHARIGECAWIARAVLRGGTVPNRFDTRSDGQGLR